MDDRGFGFARIEGSTAEVFIPARAIAKEFAGEHVSLAAGDVVEFEMGEDQSGRPCARHVVRDREPIEVTSWHATR